MDYIKQLHDKTGLRYNLKKIFEDIDFRLKRLENKNRNVTVYIEPIVAGVWTTITLRATITDSVDGSLFKFYILGDDMMAKEEIGSATVINGVAETTYNIPSNATTGIRRLYGTYIENDTYMEAEGYNTFEIRQATTITVNNVLASIGETVNFTASVRYNGSQAVTEGSVQFQLAGTNIGTAVAVDNNGVATLTYEIPSNVVDGSEIRAIFLETTTYASSTSNAGVLNIRDDVNISVTNLSVNRGDSATIEAYVTDGESNPITVGSATLFVDDTQSGEAVTVNALGKFEFTYAVASNMIKGGHTVKVVYAQNDEYNSAMGTGSMVVRTPVVLTPVNVSANAGGSVNVIVQVKDDENVAVTSGTIELTIGTGSAESVTVGNTGEASYAYSVPNDATGTISFSAHYVQTSNYMGADTSTDGIITIRKGTVIVVDSLKANVGDSVTLSSTVTDEDNELVTTGQVTYELE